MARFLSKQAQKQGLAPGSLVFVGTQKVEQATVHVIEYNASRVADRQVADRSSVRKRSLKRSVAWVNVYGLHDSELVQSIGSAFSLHPLLLEDVMHTGQRPKCEEFGSCIFLLTKMIRYDPQDEEVHAEQLSLILTRNAIITFQERSRDVFSPVRERIHRRKGKIRSLGPDYLAYALLDTVVDNYMTVIERLGGRIEDLDEEVLNSPGPETLEKISSLRQELHYLRKMVRPAREAVFQLSKLDSDLVRTSTVPYVKDLLDLYTQASEAVDTYREMLSDHLNNYNAAMGAKMNDIMRVLTIFAAIFIPLTFIAGVYGTNFEYLPELQLRYGYFGLWGMMLLLAGVMVWYFRRKGWL